MTYLVGGLRRLARTSVAMGLAMAALAPLALQAQQQATLTGRVTDEGGQPLDGATIFIAELNTGGLTNAQGRYSIVVPAARVRGQLITIQARFIGYTAATTRITLSGGTVETNFSLKQDINRLSQVVVTGVTGATEVKKLAFTVAQVSAADMPVAGANPLAQLQGKVPGANIVSASGRPGSSPQVILRGPQSLNASGRGQDPLYIIDGVVSQGGLQDINPQDIENIEVVKGAAAASLYGSRAGNGVINITTRNGKSGSEGVRFRTQLEVGTQSMENEYEFPTTHFMTMNESMDRFCVVVAATQQCSRTIDLQAEARRINNNVEPNPLPTASLQNDGGIALNPGALNLRSLYQVNRYPLAGNPVRQALTNGQTWNGTIDATGRIGQTNFFASVNQLRQEGAVRFANGYNRNSVRLNLDHQFGTDLDMQFRTSYSEASDWNTGGAWFRITRQPASADLLARDDQGRLHIRTVPQQQGAQNDNPLYSFENFRPLNRISRFVGSLNLRWRPLTWLDAEAQYGFDGRQNFQEAQQDRGYRSIPNSPAVNLGNIDRSAGRSNSQNASLNVTARRSWFDDAFNTRLTLRYLYEEQFSISQGSEGEQLAVPGLRDPNAAITNFAIDGGESSVRQIGMFSNLDLDYKGRYIIGALFRRDAASLFGAANRWQSYGRVSAAWRLSDEPWFNVPMFSDLKFRASQGTAGNRPIFSAQYETFTIGAGGALAPATLGNRNLRPEVSTETEIGLDAELFSKYGITITKAKNVIDQQLLQVPPPAIAGFTNQWINAGELTNDTWEASLRIPVLSRADLNYSVQINYDRTTSLISRLDVPAYFNSAAGQQGSETMFFIEQGGNFGQIYGRRFVTQCSELPSTFASQCGGAGSNFQVNRDGYVVWTGGAALNEGITGNHWMTALPAASAPWGNQALNWGMPIVFRDSTGAAPVLPVGNALPSYRWSMANNFGWKRFTAYALLDATVGKSVYNIARQWSLGDFMHGETDQIGQTVESARPIGYYFRAAAPFSSGIGGLYDVLGTNNNTVEDAGFVKLREVTLGYRIGSIAGFGNWTASVIGRNLLTWTNYRGFDPEVGLGGGALGSGVLNAIDAFGFPNLRQFTFSISTSF
ncbi:MAG: SusC/RagA family TonB-linked outer membrane protein [Gemmatimonadaceae bacterium]|jgi:TonB-linked SusC/RagA family outer membrane protein|nr:SusC/RagA family TonB-linked outer membrane protein [Gemmatimonadaceae bacterium]